MTSQPLASFRLAHCLATLASVSLACAGPSIEPAPTSADASGRVGTSQDIAPSNADAKADGVRAVDSGVSIEDTRFPGGDNGNSVPDASENEAADGEPCASDSAEPVDAISPDDGVSEVDIAKSDDAVDSGPVLSDALDGQISTDTADAADGGSATNTDTVDVADGDVVVGLDTTDTAAGDVVSADAVAIVLANCDAGHEAWAIRAIQVLLGRKPRGIREVHVVTDLVNVFGRAKVAAALMASPDFSPRWAAWLLDEIEAPQVGDKTNRECHALSVSNTSGPSLAETVRDLPPTQWPSGKTFTARDLLHSSLALDDLSPFYRAHLFAMVSKPSLHCKNVSPFLFDLARRADLGRNFRRVYQHRDLDCLGCHNSLQSTTDDPDPAKDRFWPIPARVEKALFGQDTGRPAAEVDAPFRYWNVATGAKCVPFDNTCQSTIPGTPMQPWGLDKTCGSFAAEAQVAPDPSDIEAFWIEPLGKMAAIWAMEKRFAAGISKLRKAKKLIVNPATLEVDGESAFAYQWCQRVTHQLWTEVMGYPLTLEHGFPRNPAQRDRLQSLTDVFIGSEFSIRNTLAAIVLDPLFNQKAPSSGCAGPTPYFLPPVFAPYSTENEVVGLKLNGLGDGVQRLGSRTAMRMADAVLGWVPLPDYPDRADTNFMAAIGVFMAEFIPGFRGVEFQSLLMWESRYGACTPPKPTPPPQFGNSSTNPESCKGRCFSWDPFVGECSCDAYCVEAGDCCADFKAVCGALAAPPAKPDRIDELVASAKAWTGAPLTVRDVVEALKDRLLAEPDILPAEATAVAAFWEAKSLDEPLANIADWPVRLRHHCGVLLKSPQFSLLGASGAVQTTVPKLLLPGGSYEALCLEVASWVKGSTVTCGASSLKAAGGGP